MEEIEIIPTIAIYLVGIMLVSIFVFGALAFGGMDLFRSKKHNKKGN